MLPYIQVPGYPRKDPAYTTPGFTVSTAEAKDTLPKPVLPQKLQIPRLLTLLG
jgi:hypothetical protein